MLTNWVEGKDQKNAIKFLFSLKHPFLGTFPSYLTKQRITHHSKCYVLDFGLFKITVWTVWETKPLAAPYQNLSLGLIGNSQIESPAVPCSDSFLRWRSKPNAPPTENFLRCGFQNGTQGKDIKAHKNTLHSIWCIGVFTWDTWKPNMHQAKSDHDNFHGDLILWHIMCDQQPGHSRNQQQGLRQFFCEISVIANTL